MKKITVEVDEDDLNRARAEGAGIAETIREALIRQGRARAWERLAALRDKVEFELDWRELRGKDDE